VEVPFICDPRNHVVVLINRELLASLKKEKPHTPWITNKKRRKLLQFTV
jgi:hypothetical protein